MNRSGLILISFLLMGTFGCSTTSSTPANTVSSGTKIGATVFDSLKEGTTSYDEAVAKLGQPNERHDGITVDYRYTETTERGKGFDAILGGVGKTQTVTECVTLVFDGKTKKLLQKRMAECDTRPSALVAK